MADLTIDDYADAGGIDASQDYFLIQQNSTNSYRKINRNTILGSTGTPVTTTASQSLTNKTLDNTNTVTLKDTLFTLQDDGDATKQAQFQLSGISAGQTRVMTIPNFNGTLATIAGTETLTNKTLTAPVINNGSITGTSITTNAIVGQSDADSGTIYGMQITNAEMNGADIQNATVTTTQVANDTLTGQNINWASTLAPYGIWWQEIARTKLSVAADSVTVNNIPARRYLMVIFRGIASGGTVDSTITFNNDTGNNYSYRSYSNGTDGTTTSVGGLPVETGTVASGQTELATYYILNNTTQQKVVVAPPSASIATAGAAAAPSIFMFAGTWVNGSQISRIDFVNSGTGDYASDTEAIILGHD